MYTINEFCGKEEKKIYGSPEEITENEVFELDFEGCRFELWVKVGSFLG